MKKIIFLLSFIPIVSLSQPSFTLTTTEEASSNNLFIKPVGQGGNKPVMIINVDGEILFSDNLGMMGWDWKVNLNKHITYYLSLIHIRRCPPSTLCRSRWSPYH